MTMKMFVSEVTLNVSIDPTVKYRPCVDIFYHHRPDPDTPLEETMTALDHLVRQGKALYVGISNYPADLAERAICMLKDLGTPCLIHQAKYSMFERWVEEDLLGILDDNGVGCIAFSQ